EQRSLPYGKAPVVLASNPGMRLIGPDAKLSPDEFRLQVRLNPDGRGFESDVSLVRLGQKLGEMSRDFVYKPAELHGKPVSCWVSAAFNDPIHVRVVTGEEDFVYYDTPPVPLVQPPPSYSDFARDAKVEGDVLLHIRVEQDGHVSKVLVRKGIAAVDEAAVQAVKKWKFKPALRDSKPLAVWIEVKVHFPPSPAGP